MATVIISRHGEEHEASRNLGVALALSRGFTLLEIAGGFYTNSVAILADAVHDTGDSVSLGLAVYLQRLSRRSSDASFTYGYRRFSVLGALIAGLVLPVGIGFVLWRTVPRLLNPEPVNAPIMVALAVVGVMVNGAAVLRLKGGTSLNERVVSWHLLEDVLGWVAVLVGSVAMIVWGVPILDPLLSILISLFVLWNIGRKLRQVLTVFLQHAPASFDREDFERRVTEMPNVHSLHHTHAWSIDGEAHVLSMHVVLARDADRQHIVDVKQRILGELIDQSFEHLTIEVGLEGEPCTSRMMTAEEHTRAYEHQTEHATAAETQ